MTTSDLAPHGKRRGRPGTLSVILGAACLAWALPAARADIIRLKSGDEIEAHVDAAADDGSYVLILPDGSDHRLPADEVATVLETTSLTIMEELTALRERVQAGDEETAFEDLIGFRKKYPKIGVRMRTHLGGILRTVGDRWRDAGNREGAWNAYRAALEYMPGDKLALQAIESLGKVSEDAPRPSLKMYFPMQPGGEWTYEEDGTTRVVRILDVTASAEGEIQAQVEEKRGLGGAGAVSRYKLVQNAEGIWKEGERRERLLAEPVEIGGRWSEQGEIVIFTWEYAGIGEKVRVGDKVYSDCLKVRITAKTIDYPVNPVVVHRYYARGVGLVKTEWPGAEAHLLREYRIRE